MDEEKFKEGCKTVWSYTKTGLKIGAVLLLGGGIIYAKGRGDGYRDGRKDEAEDIGKNLYLNNIDGTEVEDRICSNLEERLTTSYDEHIGELVQLYMDDI